ncbi:hypothetical protein [uncultured Marinobacter sp.]|uniref:hypothetical protein n=1 Tax=uncultured Marinobacter sp. TaxID=187379 RepID=UPI00258F3E53|nr:hypothetical protein [uncultured Marinobacter sp.]
MSLPKSVQQQADAAAAHFEANQNPGDTPAPEQDSKTPDATGTESQSADTQRNPDEGADKRSQDGLKDEPKRSEGYWEHRFRVLEGKYNAEVPALQREVNDLKGQVQDRERQIEELKGSGAQPGQGNDASNTGLSDEEIRHFEEEFGEDLVGFVRKLTASGSDGAKVQELERKVESFERKERLTTETTFWTALKELVPDYVTVNQNPAFHHFLAQFDPQTGKQRQQALTEAQRALDADKVADLFIAFKKQSQGQQEIPDDQIDPDTSRATQTPQGKRYWTRDEISKFYRDKTQGKYAPDEAQRLEADIFQAQQENRIR